MYEYSSDEESFWSESSDDRSDQNSWHLMEEDQDYQKIPPSLPKTQKLITDYFKPVPTPKHDKK